MPANPLPDDLGATMVWDDAPASAVPLPARCPSQRGAPPSVVPLPARCPSQRGAHTISFLPNAQICARRWAYARGHRWRIGLTAHVDRLTPPLPCPALLSSSLQLTLTGAIFSRYGLVVTPINYPLTGVNVLLFATSAWHLGRKIKADYM